MTPEAAAAAMTALLLAGAEDLAAQAYSGGPADHALLLPAVEDLAIRCEDERAREVLQADALPYFREAAAASAWTPSKRPALD